MKTFKNFTLTFIAILFILSACREPAGSNGKVEPAKSQKPVKQETDFTKPIIFSGKAGVYNNQKKFNLKTAHVVWTNDKGKKMLKQHLQLERMLVKGEIDSKDTLVPMVGIPVWKSTIEEILEEAFGSGNFELPDDFQGFYLMPAVRCCDLDEDDKYSTIMIGPIDNQNDLMTDYVYDFFEPCPEKCVDIPGFSYDLDNNPNTGYDTPTHGYEIIDGWPYITTTAGGRFNHDPCEATDCP